MLESVALQRGRKELVVAHRVNKIAQRMNKTLGLLNAPFASCPSCLEAAVARIPRAKMKTPINSKRASPGRASSHGRPLGRFSPLPELFGRNVGGACLERQGLRLPIDFPATPLLQAERELDRACRKPVSCACRLLPPTVRPMSRKSRQREPSRSAATVLDVWMFIHSRLLYIGYGELSIPLARLPNIHLNRRWPLGRGCPSLQR
jgi:hypothetical protein